MKEIFETVELEFIVLCDEDIITSSPIRGEEEA